MSKKRLFLATILARTGMLPVLRTMSGPSLVVLNYHRVRDPGLPNGAAFEDGVFGPTVAEFERQIAWLSKNTEVLTEDDVIERLDRAKRFGRPSVLITFDDGYVDNYEIVFPTLRRHSVPAIFFIPTRLISSRQLGWWDIVAYLVKRSQKACIAIDSEEISLASRARAIQRLIAKFRRQQVDPEPPSLEQLSEACGVPLPEIEVQARELMTWSQIREVSRNGISIGSHTHTHAVLSQMGRESQRRELLLSKEILERELRQRVRSVAYPFGGSLHYGRESMSLASECGYEIGFSFQGRANRGREIERFGVSRLRPPDEFELMAATVLLPGVFA